MFKFIGDYIFGFRYEYDAVLGVWYDNLVIGETLYVRFVDNGSKMVGEIVRKGNRLFFTSDTSKGRVKASDSDSELYIENVSGNYIMSKYIKVETLSLKKFPEFHTIEDKVHRILTHDFGPVGTSNKTIFEALVKKTIGKYSWCFPSSDNGVKIISGVDHNIYEKFGVITEVTNIPFRDTDYVIFIEQYVDQITDKISPKVPKFMSRIEELVHKN